MSKQVSKKNLLVCLIVSLALIIAGAFMLGFLGFNTDSSASDYAVIEVSDISFTVRDESVIDSVSDFYSGRIEDLGLSVSDVKYSEEISTGSGIYAFYVSGEAPAAEELETLRAAIDEANISGVTSQAITVTYHEAVDQPYSGYIWRTAIGAAVVLVILFAYVAIRFRVGMGVTSLIAAVHDVAITFAVVALLRIPAGVSLIGVVAAALLLSIVQNMFVFGRMRRDFRSEEMKDLPAREAVALSIKGSRKGVFTIAVAAASFIVILGVIGVFIGFDLASVMLSALIAVVASTYSSLLLSPAIYACIKEKSDEHRANKARYDYTPEKKRSKEAKVIAKQEPAEETR